MKSPEQLVLAFREAGLKVTPQRQLLFRLLHGNTAHPTAETLYEIASREMPGISLRTVYQTLTELADMGEILMVDVGTGSHRFDPNVSGHHRAVCDQCGAVQDVYVKRTPEPSAPHGFAVNDAHIVYRGQCAECSTRAA